MPNCPPNVTTSSPARNPAPAASEPAATAVIVAAWDAGKFSLGNFEFSWRALADPGVSSQWLLLLAYTTNWARRYIADQHMVQRYLIAKTDRDASRGALWNGLLCVPVWGIFMVIGVCLYGYYLKSGATPPPVSDEVVPYFIMHQLPAGIVGGALRHSLAPDQDHHWHRQRANPIELHMYNAH